MTKTLKERIIEVSLKQFLEQGIKQMTVQKLINPLKISTKTFYKYFADKEDLLKQCLFLHYAELSERFTLFQKTNLNPVISILSVFYGGFNIDFGISCEFYHDLNYYYPQLQDSISREYLSKNFIETKKMIVEGIEEGFFISDINADIAFETMILLYTNITRNSKFKDLNSSPIIMMQNTLDVYIRGICTEKGLLLFNDFQKSKK